MEILVIVACVLYLVSAVSFMIYLFRARGLYQLWGTRLLVAGFAVHTLALGLGFAQARHMPVRNLYETLSFAAWALAGTFLVIQVKFKIKFLGAWAAPLVALIVAVATQIPRQPVVAQPIFNSFWVVFHIVAVFAGEAAFALACGIGILYLLQENAIKSKNHGYFFKRLPSLELLDSAGYTCLVTGFSLLTVGLITGFIYAKAVWGHFLSWDPKEIWSGITWILYAALLHQRLTTGWRGRKSALMAIVGFVLVLFTLFGVNFLLKGHHGQFTQF
ncbi:MAG: c-type cytochrome biogenesis protein CcsB [Desulfobacterales bacterium]